MLNDSTHHKEVNYENQRSHCPTQRNTYPEAYLYHVNTINQLHILPTNITHEELYDEQYEDGLREYTLRIERRNKDQFAIMDHRGSVYTSKPDERSRNNHYTYEPSPSNRTDEFIQQTRFTLEEAIRLAEQEVENRIVYGKTVEEYKQMCHQNNKN